MEVKWSVSTAWADAGESAYVKGFAQGEGCKHNFKQGPEGQAEVEKDSVARWPWPPPNNSKQAV